MKITSDSKPLSVENDSIALSNRDNEVSNRIWLSFGGGTNDIALSFKTNKSYVLNSVEFTEILKYRLLRIIGYLFLFFLIDVLIFVFSSNKISQKTKLTLFSLLAISLFCSLIEFSDTISYTSDGRFHLNRILSLADALNGGYFPVRLHYLLLNGYGFANPIFYCDIFLYPSAILYNCGATLLFTYIPVVNFKGYKAYDLNTDKQLEIVNGDNNVLWVRIPSGYSGKFKVEFCKPWYWRVSEIVSLLTLVSIITFTATSTLRRRKCLSDHTENKEIVSVTEA